jgi:hypothetical protein
MIQISNATIEFDMNDAMEFINRRHGIRMVNKISHAIGFGNDVSSLCSNIGLDEMLALCQYILQKASKEEIEILIKVFLFKRDEIEKGDHPMKDEIAIRLVRVIDFLSISNSAENHKSEAKPKRRAL